MLHEKLRCYQLAVVMAGAFSKSAATWPRGYGYLSDQLRRAMASVVLNLAEGNARRGMAERRRFFDIARASAAEVSACLDLSLSFGLIERDDAMRLKSQAEVLAKMIRKMMWSG